MKRERVFILGSSTYLDYVCRSFGGGGGGDATTLTL